MRCKSCDYPLWQIRNRTCPECGTPFRPSAYEFTLNAVRFCCPHCSQDYYGTGPKGELVPRTFDCVKCHKTIDMDEMVLLPTEGVREEQTEGHRQPWLEWGSRRGLLSAWFATIGHAMVMPGRLMKATPPESPAGTAAWFAVSTQAVISLVTSAPWIALMGFGFLMGGGRGGPGVAGTIGIMAGFAFGAFVFALLGLLITAGVAHGLLLLTGGCAHNFKRTWQALCYSSGANIATAVPCIGYYFGWIWWLVSACIAVKEAQRVHGGRASFAVLAFPVTFVVLSVGAYAFWMYTMMTSPMMTAAMATPGGFGTGDTARVGAITGWIVSSRTPVVHALEPAVAGNMGMSNVYQFMDTMDGSGGGFFARMQGAPIGNTNLQQFVMMQPAEQVRRAKAAAAAMHPNTIAYRIGDTVLTHPGIDPRAVYAGSPAGALWVVIAWPESLVSSPSRQIVVGLADGSTQTLLGSSFAADLTDQNALRATYGLEPLPDPSTITHQQPALGQAPPRMSSAPAPAAPATGDGSTPPRPVAPKP